MTDLVNKPEDRENLVNAEGTLVQDSVAQDEIFKTLAEQKEQNGETGEYLKLYERQNKVSKELEERAEKNDIKDTDGSKLYFCPGYLSFDGDMIIYSAGMPSVQPHIFCAENGSYREIPVLPEKVYPMDKEGNGIIPRNIRKIQDGVYCVELVHMKNNSVEQRGCRGYIYLGDNSDSYFIDKTGKILDQIGELGTFVKNDGIYERKSWRNGWGFRELDITKHSLKGEFESKEARVFDQNLEKLFTIEDNQKYAICYCDNQVCICYDNRPFPRKYRIIDRTGIIGEGTEEELKSNEYMQKYLEEEEKKEEKIKENEKKQKLVREMPFGERFKEINHCVILFNEEENTATIQNDQGNTLYEIPDILDFYEDKYSPRFERKDGTIIKINDRQEDSEILFIQEMKDGVPDKSIFINKKTRKRLEFDGFKGQNCYVEGKLFEVYGGGNHPEVYDENLNKLGVALWNGSDVLNHGLQLVATEEDGKEKFYLYDRVHGKKACEVSKSMGNIIKRRLYEEDRRTVHFIVEKKDGSLMEVNPRTED